MVIPELKRVDDLIVSGRYAGQKTLIFGVQVLQALGFGWQVD